MSDEEEPIIKPSEADVSRLLKTFPNKIGIQGAKKELRACKACRLVKLRSQFIENGCENCGTIRRGERREVDLKLTPYFEGVVAVFDIGASWLKRGFDKVLQMEEAEDYFPIKFPGLYAFNIPLQPLETVDDASDDDTYRSSSSSDESEEVDLDSFSQ